MDRDGNVGCGGGDDVDAVGDGDDDYAGDHGDDNDGGDEVVMRW